jgi:predicted dehydrogenase
MLASGDIDVVTICTPSGMHGSQAREAMQAGTHVIIEKPLDITLPAVDEVLAVRRETGVKLAVTSQHRFDPAARKVHELIEQGAFGTLVLANAHVHWWRSQAYYDSGEWRGTWALDGGGVLMNQSIHSLDLLQWFMGPVRSVQAYTGTLAHTMETEDTAVAVLRFESGALGTVSATTAAYPGVNTRVEVFGSEGSAVIEDDRLRFLHLKSEGEAAGDYGMQAGATAGSGSQVPEGDAHALQLGAIIEAIEHDTNPVVDGESARRDVALILAMYESARTGREVALS